MSHWHHTYWNTRVSHPLTPSSYPVTVLYCTVLYCTVLYCIILYSTVLYLGAQRAPKSPPEELEVGGRRPPIHSSYLNISVDSQHNVTKLKKNNNLNQNKGFPKFNFSPHFGGHFFPSGRGRWGAEGVLGGLGVYLGVWGVCWGLGGVLEVWCPLVHL